MQHRPKGGGLLGLAGGGLLGLAAGGGERGEVVVGGEGTVGVPGVVGAVHSGFSPRFPT